MQTISSSQASAEVPINENFQTLIHQEVYGKKQSTTAGLTWGYWGGRWAGFLIADGTLALTASATNYVVVLRSTGAISVSTAVTNWNDANNYQRVYKLTTNATVVTATEDHRAGQGGIHGGQGIASSDEFVNAQTGAAYTYITADKGKLVTHSNAAAIAGTLPQAGASFPAGWWMDVQNTGAGTLTITPTTSTLDGAASLVLATAQGVRLVSDGVNYFTQRGADTASPRALTVPVNKLAVGTAASGAIAGWEVGFINNPGYNILSGATAGGGWLQDLTATPSYADVDLPFAVVIGDSIAEGHPALHGRLDATGAGGYTPAHPSAPGQVNYEISRLTCAHWFNHGTGSQTTTDILARFNRDALGQVSDPGDGRGNKTLSGKPYAVLVIAGANDLAAIAEATTKANLTEMLSRLKANQIIPIFTTVAPSSGYSAADNTKAASINSWMLTEFRAMGAHVFDLWTWGSNGSGGVKADRYVDTIHPNKSGYALLAKDVVAATDADLVMGSFRVEFKVDPTTPPTGFAPPTSFSVTKESVTVTAAVAGDWVVFNNAGLPALQSPSARLTVLAPATGRSGINRVVSNFGRLPAQTASANGLSVAAVILKNASGVWEIPTTFVQKGVTAISANTSNVIVTCASASVFLTGLVGGAAVSNNIRISASWSEPPVSQVTLNFGNGSAAVDPTSASVPNSTYYSIFGAA